MLRFYREKKGMRQLDLARSSGYSVRLIGKAEAGKPISPETIEDLAEALSSKEFPIGPEDLISHPERIAQKYIDNFLDYESNRAWFESFIDTNISIKVLVATAGTARKFAYQGIQGFEEYLQDFCTLLHKSTNDSSKLSRKIFSSGNEVVVWHEYPTYPVTQLGAESPKVFDFQADVSFMSTKLVFSSGRLCAMEDRIVSNSNQQLFEQLRSRLEIESNVAPWPDFASRENESPKSIQSFYNHDLGGSQ